MTPDPLIAALAHLPDSARIQISVRKGDLVRGLEAAEDRPERLVTTLWCEDHLGRSREWWAEECRSGRIPEAYQEDVGAPWYLPLGAARRHIREHTQDRTRGRSRRRGPRTKEAGT